MKKKIVFLLCLALCVLTFAGCSLSLTTTNKNFKESTLKASAEEYIKDWFSKDYQAQADQIDESVAYYDQYYQEMAEAGQVTDDQIATYQEQRAQILEERDVYVELAKEKEKYGDYKSQFGKIEYTISADTATVTENINTSKGKAVFSVTFDEDGNITDSKIDEYKTIGQKMGKAGLNTVMSMLIVFLVLIFIAIIISLFKFIGAAQKKPEPQAAPQAPAPVPVLDVSEEENLTDDLELVAVITAAIAAASETESADGLVIRSIIRR